MFGLRKKARSESVVGKPLEVVETAKAAEEISPLPKKLTLADVEQIEENIVKLAQKAERIQKKINDLLPIEYQFSEKLKQQYTETMFEKNRLITRLKYTEYDLFDINILEIRDENNMPRFAPFAVKGPGHTPYGIFCTYPGAQLSGDNSFYVSYYRNTENLPSELFKFYEDLNDSTDMSNLKAHYVKFTGILPDNIRQKLEDWKNKFERLYIVAEVTDCWDQAEVKVLPPPDPFVIGFDGYNHYLLAKFDVTPFERWAEAEMLI